MVPHFAFFSCFQLATAFFFPLSILMAFIHLFILDPYSQGPYSLERRQSHRWLLGTTVLNVSQENLKIFWRDGQLPWWVENAFCRKGPWKQGEKNLGRRAGIGRQRGHQVCVCLSGRVGTELIFLLGSSLPTLSTQEAVWFPWPENLLFCTML